MIKRFCVGGLTVLAAGGRFRRHHRTKGRNLFLGLSLLLTLPGCGRLFETTRSNRKWLVNRAYFVQKDETANEIFLTVPQTS
jgi:hypothetical protein